MQFFDLPSFRPLRAILRLVVFVAVLLPGLAQAQTITQNSFVGAAVTSSDGLLTIYNGPVNNRQLLTYIDKSYLTVKVGSGASAKYYSNNSNADLPQPPDILLENGQTSKIADTIQTRWPENGFDILQDVYPVAFTSSGVIVLSIKIVNHSGVPFPVQAQFLLDNMNSNPDSANDNPYLITRYGFIRNWQTSPPSPIPSFYLAFEHPPTDTGELGVVGIGYQNDTFPPRPLGLLPLSLLQFGDWTTTLVFYTWAPAPSSGSITDVATFMQGQSTNAHAQPGDTVTEIMRTAYGTPEWCYDRGNIFGFALYPHHLYWSRDSVSYTPNPFQVETFLFNLGAGATSGTTIRQTIGNPIVITSPKPAGLPNTQLQNIGAIPGDGFVDVRWTDSALVMPGGCAASFPVDVHFDVTSSNVKQPIFLNPWDCSITVDCPNPDTIPPTFQNSFAGCDSVMRDTITAEDNGDFDLGIDTITYASPDLKPAQYRITFSPAPPYACIKTPVKIFVQQVDTFQAGHVIFTFTDCAGNISRDTICFTKHPPLPDLTAPKFFDSTLADCHVQCSEWNVTDTQHSATSIDRGVDSIVVVSDTNMTPSGIPPGGKYPPGTPEATFRVCVTDSLLDGTMILRASDTAGNKSYDTITYCTTPDTLPPIITATAFDPTDSGWHVHVTEARPWDRGIDSVWITQASNVVTVPSPIPNPIGCKPTYNIDVRVVDTTQCASATLYAKDCAGNISSPMPLTFTKGAKPVIVASKTLLCTGTDSAVLDAGPGFTGYLWSTGDTTREITVKKAGSYFVTVQEGVGCPATSDPVTITFSPATPKIVPSGPVALCAPDSAQLDAGAGFATYQWLNNGASIPGETSQTMLARATGSYSVQVTNAAGCSGTSQAVAVTINPLPPQPVITGVNNVLTSTPSASYQWLRNDTIIHGATNQSYTDLTGGSYTVTVTDANGCSSTSQPFSNSGSTVVAVPSMVVAKQSDNVTIPLSIISSQNLPLNINRTFTAVLRFNKTLLVPQGGYVSKQVQGNDLVVTYTGQSSTTQGVLQTLSFTAALGNDSCTTVTIDTFYWSTPNISVTRQNGNFCLIGLCTQGGTRLIDPEGTVSLSDPVPNPAYSSIQMDYNLIEQGQTTLIVYDVLGHEVLRLLDADQAPGGYRVVADISSLPAGRYVCTLRTPTIVTSQNLQIVR